jgi:phosphinothricin acetyltransferase
MIPTVRPAISTDRAALLALRNWYIAHSFATFDEIPLSAPALDEWFSSFGDGPHRLLIATEEGGDLLGYCSSQTYRPHPAFARTVETSIYVHPRALGRGVGSALYEQLFHSIAGQGLHRALAGIALPNDASVRLHERHGFRRVGVFSEYACKHGRLLGSQWMEREL